MTEFAHPSSPPAPDAPERRHHCFRLARNARRLALCTGLAASPLWAQDGSATADPPPTTSADARAPSGDATRPPEPVPSSAELGPTTTTATATAPPPAAAAAPAPVTQLEAIVVTGEKLGRRLSETATSTAVARPRDIAAQGDGKLQEVVSHAANVVRLGSDREISIRGVPQNGIGGEGETISIVVDGVQLPQRAANFGGPLGVFDVEQVEVLRGAQSTTQGQNSLAGAVVLTTREPRQAWDAKARYERSNLDGESRAVAGGGAVVPGWLAVRVSLEDRFFRSNIRNTTLGTDDAGRESLSTQRVKLLLTPPNVPYRALLALSRANNEFGDNLHDATRCERCETANRPYSETYRGTVYSLQQSYVFGPRFRLEAVTGYTPGRDFRFADFDRTERNGGSAIFDYREVNRSQEVRLRVTPGEKLRGFIGVYAARLERYALNATVEPIPVAGGAALLTGEQFSDQTYRTVAGFGEADWNFYGPLTLTLGARYQDERVARRQVSQLDFAATTAPVGVPVVLPLPDAATDILSGLTPDTVPPDYDVSGAQRTPVFLPKVGVAWQVTPNHRLALTGQRGYRSGGTSASFFGGTRSDYGPEFTETLELALRSQFPAFRAGVNANVFYTRWKDQQVTIGDEASFFTTTANAGRSHLQGAEIEFTARPFTSRFLDGLEPFFSLGLLHTEFDEFVNNGDDYAGNRFPFAPKRSGTLGSHYRLGGFFAYVAATYNGSYFGRASNAPDSFVPAKTLLTARLGYQYRALKLSVFGRNLTDDTNLQDQFVVGTGANARVAKRYGEPRIVGAALEVAL